GGVLIDMAVDDYHVIELVGEGSFGKVYKGRRKYTRQQILRKLKHENIIEMLDAFETPQEFCVVTEFAQVKALYYLHSNRIIHRDMKPQNILIGAGSVVKVSSKLVREQPYNHTADLWSLGVILYSLFWPVLVRDMQKEVLAHLNHDRVYANTSLTLLGCFSRILCYAYGLIFYFSGLCKDPVKYPENMSANFKSFLKGLLNKVPLCFFA
ncbi:hypothetical protein BHM03_00023551, partial [Ensete ventricosum]